MKGIVICPRSGSHILAPRGIFAPREMSTIDAGLEGLLTELFRLLNARVAIPAISGAGSDVGPMVAIHVGSGEPRGAPLLIHVDDVVIVGELETVVILASIGPDLGSVLLHGFAREFRKRNRDAIQKVGIVTGTGAIVLIDGHTLFRGLGFNRGWHCLLEDLLCGAYGNRDVDW